MSKPSSTNYPKGFLANYFSFLKSVNIIPGATGCYESNDRTVPINWNEVLLGGYSSEVPPLPIPNREVKLTNADGTALIVWESR